MAQILVVSQDLNQSEQTRQALNECGYPNVRLASVHEAKTFDQEVDLIVYDCLKLEKLELTVVFNLRQQFEQIPILILAKEISIYAYRRIDLMKKMVAVQRPIRAEVFAGVLEQILAQSEKLEPRCARFYTDEPVQLIVLNSGLFIPTRMKNYSAGGAFLEYRGISLKVGDKLQVGFLPKHGGERKDAFQMQARVIWIKEGDNPRSPARGIGIQFLETNPS